MGAKTRGTLRRVLKLRVAPGGSSFALVCTPQLASPAKSILAGSFYSAVQPGNKQNETSAQLKTRNPKSRRLLDRSQFPSLAQGNFLPETSIPELSLAAAWLELGPTLDIFVPTQNEVQMKPQAATDT